MVSSVDFFWLPVTVWRRRLSAGCRSFASWGIFDIIIRFIPLRHVTPPCQGTAHPHHASACQSPDGQGAREARRTLCPLSPRAHHVTAAVVRSLCRNFYSHGACKNMWILSFEVAALSLRLRVSAVGTSGFAHRRPSRLGWLARLSGAPAPCQGSGTGGHGARQVLRPHCSCRAGHATRLPVGGGRTGGGEDARGPTPWPPCVSSGVSSKQRIAF